MVLEVREMLPMRWMMVWMRWMQTMTVSMRG